MALIYKDEGIVFVGQTANLSGMQKNKATVNIKLHGSKDYSSFKDKEYGRSSYHLTAAGNMFISLCMHAHRNVGEH